MLPTSRLQRKTRPPKRRRLHNFGWFSQTPYRKKVTRACRSIEEMAMPLTNQKGYRSLAGDYSMTEPYLRVVSQQLCRLSRTLQSCQVDMEEQTTFGAKHVLL